MNDQFQVPVSYVAQKQDLQLSDFCVKECGSDSRVAVKRGADLILHYKEILYIA